MFYATAIEQEAPHELPDKKPPNMWPADGVVELKDVVFSYRSGLPPVLTGITMTVSAREKIGIVGRTGAGMSSMMMGILSNSLRRFFWMPIPEMALSHLAELTSGSILLDGVDVSTMGLTDLRKALAIIL